MNNSKEGYNNSLEEYLWTLNKYLQDSLWHTITEAQWFDRAFVSFKTSYFGDSRMNPSNPSLLLNLTLALELQKTLSSFQTKIEFFWVFFIFHARPWRYLVADSINNAFRRNKKLQTSMFQVIFLTLGKAEHAYIWSSWRMPSNVFAFEFDHNLRNSESSLVKHLLYNMKKINLWLWKKIFFYTTNTQCKCWRKHGYVSTDMWA